ncbi:unnamed protein product [Schistocephalus solidus]|uniref:Uncharacterized protein n=1 Tax=Schistocephalus solidus TaxID=70667 RepID=A0A183T7M7_SCHSO|nr:unnamed protein product [Schistocephalus solidus]
METHSLRTEKFILHEPAVAQRVFHVALEYKLENFDWIIFVAGTKKKTKGRNVGAAVEIEPGEELVNLGKSILRSRRQLMHPAPARRPPAEPQSIFSEKDFKEFSADPQKFFCS